MSDQQYRPHGDRPQGATYQQYPPQQGGHQQDRPQQYPPQQDWPQQYPPQQGYQPYPPQQGWQPPQQPGGQRQAQPRRPKKRHTGRNVFLGILGAFVLIIVVAVAASGGGSSNPSQNKANSVTGQSQVSPAPAGSNSVAPAASQYTVAQQQAIKAAQGYLSMGQGFSRSGLIQQLDSPDGDGFSKSLAKFAVNHVKVNWMYQAVLSAKGYLKMGGFSCSSLEQQLDSQAGEGFTYSQAAHAAKAVGLC